MVTLAVSLTLFLHYNRFYAEMTLLGDCDIYLTAKVNPDHFQNETTFRLGQDLPLPRPSGARWLLAIHNDAYYWLSVKGLAPLYITELVSTVAAQTSRPGLRSADTTNYVQPRTRTKFAERAFSYAGPAVWNLLPNDLRRTPTINSFKRKLKT